MRHFKPVQRLFRADHAWTDHVREWPLLNPVQADRRKLGFFGCP